MNQKSPYSQTPERMGRGAEVRVPFPEFDEAAQSKKQMVRFPSGRVLEIPLQPSAELMDVISAVEGFDLKRNPGYISALYDNSTVPRGPRDSDLNGYLAMETVLMGGAGDDGAYKDDFVRALKDAGISNVRASPSVSMGGDLPLGFVIDAGLSVPRNNNDISPRYIDNPELRRRSDPATGEQYNLVGYSYGAAFLAQQALTEARRGNVVDNLVLIGAPINADLVQALDRESNIRRVHYVNLDEYGDPIYPGMSDAELIANVPKLVFQMMNKSGHFYYSGENDEGAQRRDDLARQLFDRGLR